MALAQKLESTNQNELAETVSALSAKLSKRGLDLNQGELDAAYNAAKSALSSGKGVKEATLTAALTAYAKRGSGELSNVIELLDKQSNRPMAQRIKQQITDSQALAELPELVPLVAPVRVARPATPEQRKEAVGRVMDDMVDKGFYLTGAQVNILADFLPTLPKDASVDKIEKSIRIEAYTLFARANQKNLERFASAMGELAEKDPQTAMATLTEVYKNIYGGTYRRAIDDEAEKGLAALASDKRGFDNAVAALHESLRTVLVATAKDKKKREFASRD